MSKPDTLQEIIARQHAGRDPHDDPLTDKLLAEILRLAEEVCVLNDRLDTCERLLADGHSPDEASIDAYEPNATATRERLARHSEYFERLFVRLSDAPD